MSSSFDHKFICKIVKLEILTQSYSAIARVSLPELGDFWTPWEKSSSFSVFQDLKFKTSLSRNFKIKLHSVRALKQYLNEKNVGHGRETALISKSTAQSN